MTSTTTPSTALPTTYMSFASWVGQQGGSMQSMSSEEKAMMHVQYNAWLANLNAGITTPVAETVAATETAAVTTTTPTTTTLATTHSPSSCAGGLGSTKVPAPAVTPAPPYEISPEQQAWEEKVGGYLTSTLAQGGIGIPEETMALMTQKTTDTLKAKETEDIRVMRNNMERRGITNSGFVFSNEQKIRSGTTMAIANSITDLNIQNSLMKMASFENAMGQAAQFLGYLGEQTQLKNQPAYLTWQAQQQATLYQYQATMDLYKIRIQQAYAQNNMILAGQIAATAAAKLAADNVNLAQMEIDANAQAAKAQGFGNILGIIITGFFGLFKPS